MGINVDSLAPQGGLYSEARVRQASSHVELGSSSHDAPLEWWTISKPMGELVPGQGAVPHPSASRIRLSERYLEALVALNPDLIGARAHQPLRVHGGERSSVDQVYRDDLGRMIVVEFKRARAKRIDVIQLLGYGHQFGYEPVIVETDDADLGIDVVGVTHPNHPELRHMFEQFAQTTEPEAFIKRIDARIKGRPKTVDLGRAARIRLGLTINGKARVQREQHHLPAMAPRMVLVANSFDDEAMELVDDLNWRWLDITLIALDVFASSDDVIVTRQIVRDLPAMNALREAIGDLWRSKFMRERFKADGFWFSTKANQPQFSFSGVRTSYASLTLAANSDELLVGTRVANVGLTEGNRLMRILAARLPTTGAIKSESDWIWTFPKSERAEWIEMALEVARVSDAVLGRAT